MAGKVLERRRGAGRPPGPRAPLPSVLHSTVGMLEASKRYYYTIRLIYSIDVEYQWTFSLEISKILIVLLVDPCTVHPQRARNLNLFMILVFEFRVSIFGVWYLFVDNIAVTNTIIRKYYNELFLSRDINSSVFEGIEISNEVTLSDNFISNARIYSGGYYGWSAFHVSRQLDATNKLFEQVILEPLKFYLPLKHTSIRI